MIISKIKTWWQSLRYYVIADPADNSVTLSKALFNHIRKNTKDSEEARVFVFKVTKTGCFGFMTNPDIEQPTQMCDIQYNKKYRCVGFESLCPSVGKILYEYGLPATKRVKLSVSIHQLKKKGKIYYQFEKPYAEYIRKHQKG